MLQDYEDSMDVVGDHDARNQVDASYEYFLKLELIEFLLLLIQVVSELCRLDTNLDHDSQFAKGIFFRTISSASKFAFKVVDIYWQKFFRLHNDSQAAETQHCVTVKWRKLSLV